MPSYESSMLNLEKAKARWRQPLPWRSSQESLMIRRYAFQWLICRDPNRPSGRAWARQLGISHTWLQKLVRNLRQTRAKCGGCKQRGVTPNLRNSAVRRTTRSR
jgi:hypothetical protein